MKGTLTFDRKDEPLTDPRLEALLNSLQAARALTLEIIDLVEDLDFTRGLHPDFSPLRWHFGHVAAFESWWVGTRAGKRPSPRPDLDVVFDPRRYPKADRIHLPPREELASYAEQVRETTLEVLSELPRDSNDPLLHQDFVGEFILEHERQHQEILSFLLAFVPLDRLRTPTHFEPCPDRPWDGTHQIVEITGGPFRQGATGRVFAYDNELMARELTLDAFGIDRFPVSETTFLKFMEDGGYQSRLLWSDEGWLWRDSNLVESPRGWYRDALGSWMIRATFEARTPRDGVPVCGVSRHEADAFAVWAGQRLPTESEWERVAAWDPLLGSSRVSPWGDASVPPAHVNCSHRRWGTWPCPTQFEATEPSGCVDLAGQVWEWTSSPFAPYPGFQPFPYDDYSMSWFDNQHWVLRGGSWATHEKLCRASFRNWYHPFVREINAGFRCARRD